MKLKDCLRTKIYLLKNRTKNILLNKGTLIKRSVLGGKNIVGSNNSIVNCQIGFGAYLGSNNFLESVKIGKYCSIASELKIILGSHPVKDNVSTHPAFFLKKHDSFNKIQLSYVKENKYDDRNLVDDKWNAVIGNDVWIGSDVKIFQGVTIGDGAVIGTGALVIKNIEPYTIVGGVPAKTIRKRFSEENIDYLMQLKWWDKDEKWIKEYAEYFENIEILKEKLVKNMKR